MDAVRIIIILFMGIDLEMEVTSLEQETRTSGCFVFRNLA